MAASEGAAAGAPDVPSDTAAAAAAAAVPAEPHDEGPPPFFSALSQLALEWQGQLERLHDAVYGLPRFSFAEVGDVEAESRVGRIISHQGYARDIVTAQKRFLDIAGRLPPELRRCRLRKEASGDDDGDSDDAELASLLQEDAEMSRVTRYWTDRLALAQKHTDAELRQLCKELCGDAAVTIEEPAAEEESDEEGEEHPPLGEADKAPPPAAEEAPLRGRLQDLVQEKSQRFVVELEFLQCLASPEYVHWLACQKFFEEPGFLEFLTYLRYWCSPPYVQHVVYPQSLRMLHMLGNPDFRLRLNRVDAQAFLMSQLWRHWGASAEAPIELLPHTAVSGVPSEEAAGEAAPADDVPALAQVRAPADGAVGKEAQRVGRQYLANKIQGQDLEIMFQRHRQNWRDVSAQSDMLVLGKEAGGRGGGQQERGGGSEVGAPQRGPHSALAIPPVLLQALASSGHGSKGPGRGADAAVPPAAMVPVSGGIKSGPTTAAEARKRPPSSDTGGEQPKRRPRRAAAGAM
eukprot:TRINITY_DN5186_c1_g1_i1.p1 TRINITY_DN5186_c1_g1~~TRINITY_DN5186_c1_g1_i1.p1  ORF type:complete len:518 (-),score=152.75 TRINITY_DN5186_c1_g1_i1:116-1669(-)